MGKATNPRRLNPRSRGGRPRLAGPRTKSGRLKHRPNERVMQIRAAFGLEHTGQPFSPVQIAQRRGWLSQADCHTAQDFSALYAKAGLGPRSLSASAGLEVKEGTTVSRDPNSGSFFATIPDAEVAALWDDVFNDDGSRMSEEAASLAMLRWKQACSAMTPAECQEVHDFCVRDVFPQWILERARGCMESVHENRRMLLISGLKAVRRSFCQTVGSSRYPNNHVA